LKGRLLEYENIEEFLVDIRKEFGERGKQSMKVAELRRLKEGRKIIEEVVQKFRRAARESRYKRRSLVEEFRRGINTIIHQRLMESE